MTKTALKKTLTRNGFLAWLESLDGNDVVGHACKENSCPLARFIAIHVDKKYDVRVRPSWIDVHVDGEGFDAEIVYVPTPKWAYRFIDYIDRSGQFLVTAEQAIDALKRLWIRGRHG